MLVAKREKNKNKNKKKTSRSKIFSTGCKNLRKNLLAEHTETFDHQYSLQKEVNRQTTKLLFDKEKAVKVVNYIALYIGNEYSSLIKLNKLMKI